MKSMTGYGKGVAQRQGLELTVEIRTVNNRFLEINNRIPKAFVSQDTAVRKRIGAVLKRGSVEVYYNLRNTAGDVRIAVDQTLAAQYAAAARALAALGVPDDLGTSALLRLPDVVRPEETELAEDAKAALTADAVDAALGELDAARRREGQVLARDLGAVLGSIRGALDRIAARAPEVLADYRARLRERIAALSDAVPLDENRLASECAFYADRVDTNEEIQRLYSHLGAFEEILASEGEAGRKLDFLTQEMTREANTLGSKCNDLVTTNLILGVKNEIEKLKEQSRNAE